MAALADNVDRRPSDTYLTRSPREFNVNANTDTSVLNGIFRGSIVFKDAVTGRATLITNAGANPVVGISESFVTTTASASTNFPVRVRSGFTMEFTLAGVTQLNIGDTVYATTDNDITLTAAGASRLGILEGIVSGTTVKVHVEPEV